MEKVLTRHIGTPKLWKLETYRSLGGYQTLEKALREYKPEEIVTIVRDAGLRGRRGAGAYICGEETGLIESLEGKRAYPRIKPPFPANIGAFGMPTVVNNIETLADVRHIVERGAAWYNSIGPERNRGTRLWCVSGNVRRPGVYELPLGIPLRDIIFEHAGGLHEGRT